MTTHLESRTGRNLGLAAFALIVTLAMFALPMLGSASTFSSGINVNHEGDPIENDLYVSAITANITADVQGDVTLATLRGTLDSTVGGSVHVIAGNVTIRGTIEGTLYIAAGRVQLEGTVQGNTVVAGGRLEFGDGARVGGDLIIFGAQAQVDGVVDGKLYGSVLHYDQDGDVSGNVELQSDSITLGSNASIGDDFRYQSQTGADIDTNAQVGGEVVHTDKSPWNGIGSGALAPYGGFMRLVWSLMVGAVLVAIAPRFFYRASGFASKIVAPGIWGVVGLVLIPILTVLAFLSVLLIPIGFFAMAFMMLGLYLSQIVVGLTIGRAILPRKWRDGSRGFLLFALTIGIIIIGALRLAPLPYLDVITLVIVTVWGFGAVLMVFTDLSSTRTRQTM